MPQYVGWQFIGHMVWTVWAAGGEATIGGTLLWATGRRMRRLYAAMRVQRCAKACKRGAARFNAGATAGTDSPTCYLATRTMQPQFDSRRDLVGSARGWNHGDQEKGDQEVGEEEQAQIP